MSEQPNYSLTEEANTTISSQWNLGSCTFTQIKVSENHTYLVKTQNDAKYIVRLTPENHRSQESIQSELEFITLLSKSDAIHVCSPIANKNGRYLSEIVPYADKKPWYAALFEFAQGGSVMDKFVGLFDDNIVASVGKTVAELHNVASRRGNNPEKWNQMQKNVPLGTQTHENCSDMNVIRKRAKEGHEYSKMLERIYDAKVGPFLDSLGKPTDATYGVIHGDLTLENYFAHGDQIYLFDFDQMHVNWYGADIGCVLTWARFFDEMGYVQGFDFERYKNVFLDAYKKVNTGMNEAGHLEQNKLEGFELYREWYNSTICVGAMIQHEKGERHFEQAIIDIGHTLIKRCGRHDIK